MGYYFETNDGVKAKPQDMDELVSVCEDWTARNVDGLEIPSDKCSLGISKNKLTIANDEFSEHPLTRSAFTGLLKKLSLPVGLARFFDSGYESTSLQESHVDRGISFINDVMKDAAVPLNVRYRDDPQQGMYARQFLAPGELLLDYDTAAAGIAKGFQKLDLEVRPQMFRECTLDSDTFALGMIARRVRSLEDKVYSGMKFMFSETGTTRPDIYEYVWTKICSNGMMGWAERGGHIFSLSGVRNNLGGTVVDGMNAVLTRGEQLASRMGMLREVRVKLRHKTLTRQERLNAITRRVSKFLKVPTSLNDSIATTWEALEDWTLYGYHDALTRLARNTAGAERMGLETRAGKLANTSHNALARLVA